MAAQETIKCSDRLLKAFVSIDSVSNQLTEGIFLSHVPSCMNIPGARFLAEGFHLTWSSCVLSLVSIGASPDK